VKNKKKAFAYFVLEIIITIVAFIYDILGDKKPWLKNKKMSIKDILLENSHVELLASGHLLFYLGEFPFEKKIFHPYSIFDTLSSLNSISNLRIYLI